MGLDLQKLEQIRQRRRENGFPDETPEEAARLQAEFEAEKRAARPRLSQAQVVVGKVTVIRGPRQS